MSTVRAYRIMVEMGDHLLPPMLRRFIAVNGLFPTGSRVQLQTGEMARVDAQTDRPERPRVEIETTPDGAELAVLDRRLVDLRRPPGGVDRVVVRSETRAPTLLGI